jgi:chorismate mutase
VFGVFGVRLGVCALSLALVAFVAAGGAGAAPNPLIGLVDAAAVRLQTADPVAASKWLSNGGIEDRVRADQVLAAVTDDAVSAGIDADYVRQVFTDQISATEAVEYGRFSGWKLNPSSAPAIAPDLSASRSAIDALNHRMVAEIASDWQVLHGPDCAADRDDAVAAAADAHQLDTLYRAALDFAVRSYCQPIS